mgnify:CR=1 FL=1
MTNQNIDFSAPLSTEDGLETASIQRLAEAVGASESIVRRWMYEEGILGPVDPENEARRPWLSRAAS